MGKKLELLGTIGKGIWTGTKGLATTIFGVGTIGGGYVAYDQVSNQGQNTNGFMEWLRKFQKKTFDASETTSEEAANLATNTKWAGIWANLENLALMIDRFLGGNSVFLKFANLTRQAQQDENPLAWNGKEYVEIGDSSGDAPSDAPTSKPTDPNNPDNANTMSKSAPSPDSAMENTTEAVVGASVGYAASRTAVLAGEAAVNKFKGTSIQKNGGFLSKLLGKSKIGKLFTASATLFAGSSVAATAGELPQNVTSSVSFQKAVEPTGQSLADAAADVVPFGDAVKKGIEAGEVNDAVVKSATVDASGLTGLFAGAAGGTALGTKVGMVIGGTLGSVVPVLGTAAGAAAGAAVGGITGGFTGAVAGELAGSGITGWAWNTLSNVFNTEANPDVAVPVQKLETKLAFG